MKLKRSDLRSITYQIQTPQHEFYKLTNKIINQKLVLDPIFWSLEIIGLLYDHVYYENIEYRNYN